MQISFFKNLKNTALAILNKRTDIIMSNAISSTTSFRDKPFIVICGCTGTGKTKLSIQLAEWLIKNNKQTEIINADAMQVIV